MDYNLTDDLNSDLNTEPNYITDKKFKLKMKFNINKRKKLKYNDIIDNDIDELIINNKINNKINNTEDKIEIIKIEKRDNKNKNEEVVCKRLSTEMKIKNKIYNQLLNNKTYLHNNKECILNNKKIQFDFDYIKCKNCDTFYCEYCFLKDMNVKITEYQYILYNNNNEYIFKKPFNKDYKCFGCNNKIPIISDKLKCNMCSTIFIKKINKIKNNKCFYCSNYLCDSCKNKNYNSIYENFRCFECS